MNETLRGKQSKRQLIQEELLICESELHDLMRIGHGKNKWVGVALSDIEHVKLTWEEITLFFKNLNYLTPKLNTFTDELTQRVLSTGIQSIQASLYNPNTLDIKYSKDGLTKTLRLFFTEDNSYSEEAVKNNSDQAVIRPNNIGGIYQTLREILPIFTIVDAHENYTNLGHEEVTMAYLESFLSNKTQILEKARRDDIKRRNIENPPPNDQKHNHIRDHNEIIVQSTKANKQYIENETLTAILKSKMNQSGAEEIYFPIKIAIDTTSHKPISIEIDSKITLPIIEIETEETWSKTYASLIDSSTMRTQAAMMLMYELYGHLTFKLSLTIEKSEHSERVYTYPFVFLKTPIRPTE